MGAMVRTRGKSYEGKEASLTSVGHRSGGEDDEAHGHGADDLLHGGQTRKGYLNVGLRKRSVP